MSTPELTPTPAASIVGQVISGRYRVRELLGEGGMGAVYLAEHTHMRKRVALKLLHAEMSRDEEVLARFKREAEAAAHVEHPNVAAATDFGQTDDGSFFLVLEYVEGQNLRKVIDGGPLSSVRALHIARQMALALDRAHGGGIVHRDLKPENIMLVQKDDDPDFVKVLDFGIAKLEPHGGRDTTQPLTRFGTILGTPEYMAPEQALGEVVGPSADLYAVGVMLYEMLTGRHPFEADDRMAILSMHIVAPVPKMTDRNPDVSVPAPLADLVERLLHKEAKQRPPSARALAEEIDLIATQMGVEPVGPPLSSPEVGTPDISVQSTSEPRWTPSDALAKTDYGLAAVGAPPSIFETAYPFESVALPAALAPLKKVHRNIVLTVAATIPIGVFLAIIVFIFARRSSATTDDPLVEGAPASAAPAPRPKNASPDQVRVAVAGGVAAIQALAEEFPEDASVQRELAMSLHTAGRNADALRAVEATARLDPNTVDTSLLGVVVQLAERRDSSDDAFALLEGPLKSRGVDGLLELATSKVAAVKSRALSSLARPDVRSNASPAATIVLDMKSANSCAAKHEVIERAKEAGDDRVLSTLKALKNPRGCGFMRMRDCHPCLRKDDALEDAIKAIEARSK